MHSAELSRTNKSVMFSFWDGGRGHLARVRNLAIEATRRGHEVSFITSQKYAQELGALAIAENIHVVPNRPPQTPAPPYDFPLYSHAFRHAQRLRGLGFNNSDWIRQTTESEISAIKKTRPDVLVNDYRDTVRTSAEICGVPVVGITQSTGNVDGFRLGSWVEPPDGVMLPDCTQSFNDVRADYGLMPIEDELYMFEGDVNVIPSIPALDPLERLSPRSHYVGMISQWETGNLGFEPLANPGELSVFSYVGEPSRPSFGYEKMLAKVIESNPELGFYVVGDPSRYDTQLKERRENDSIRIEPFIPGSAAISESSAILTHGGHSTTCLALSLGKPIIGVGAYQSEAATTLRNVDKAHAGLYLPHSERPLDQVDAPDLGDNMKIFGYWHTELTGEHITEAIRTVLEDETYHENAMRLGAELVAYGGVKKALDIIERV